MYWSTGFCIFEWAGSVTYITILYLDRTPIELYRSASPDYILSELLLHYLAAAHYSVDPFMQGSRNHALQLYGNLRQISSQTVLGIWGGQWSVINAALIFG